MTINERWPLVNREVRRWVAGNVFTTPSPFSLDEIEKAGGPDSDDPYWARDREGSNDTFQRMRSGGCPPMARSAAKVRSISHLHYIEPAGLPARLSVSCC